MKKRHKGVIGILVLAMTASLTACDAPEGAQGVLEGARGLFETAKEAVLGLFGEDSGGNPEDTVAVQSVSMLAGIGAYGMQDRYSGVVVAQATQEINKQEDRTVKELKVSVGDTVKKGDVLFTYDIDEMRLAVDTGKLELEKLQNSITSTNKQIEQLEKDKKKAAQADQLSYSIEIQSLQADVKEYEYQLQTKTVQQELLEKTLNNADVLSPIDGVVQSLNENGSTDDYGNTSAYIVLMETGNYRVKGTINEMNRAAMTGMEGQSLIIRSRVNTSDIWYGRLDKVDTENPVQNNSDSYSSGDDSSQSTNYPFYVSLDNSEGLMMGQHVYIELDQGQAEAKTGIWLPSSFIDQNGGTFIWAATSRDRLEKREVTLGDYDEELDQYEILDGILASDYVAIADISLKEGAPVTRYDEAYFEEGDWGEEDWEEEGEWEEDIDLEGDGEEWDDGGEEADAEWNADVEWKDEGAIDLGDEGNMDGMDDMGGEDFMEEDFMEEEQGSMDDMDDLEGMGVPGDGADFMPDDEAMDEDLDGMN